MRGSIRFLIDEILRRGVSLRELKVSRGACGKRHELSTQHFRNGHSAIARRSHSAGGTRSESAVLLSTGSGLTRVCGVL